MAKKLPWLLPGIRRPNFTLQRISIRIPTRIPRGLIYVVVYGIIFYIFSGGAYNIVNKDTLVTIGSRAGAPLFIAPNTHVQYLIEGLVAGFVFAFAAGSLYLFDHATKYAFDVSTAQKIEIIATILVIVWFVVVLLLFKAKTG